MDREKCRALKLELEAQQSPPIVPIDRFFDGNDDDGSIGCNLGPHLMEPFRDTLTGLLHRSDVEGVYAQIFEVDPGEDSWPFTDLILVAGTISVEQLQALVIHLQPDEVAPAQGYSVSPLVAERHGLPVLVVWWD